MPPLTFPSLPPTSSPSSFLTSPAPLPEPLLPLLLLLLAAESGNSCTLQIWTINGKLIRKIMVEEEIHTLAYSAAPEGVYVNILAGGLANGNIKYVSQWSVD